MSFGNDENDVQGDTEADAYGPNDIAIANAEGIASEWGGRVGGWWVEMPPLSLFV